MKVFSRPQMRVHSSSAGGSNEIRSAIAKAQRNRLHDHDVFCRSKAKHDPAH